MIRSRLLRFVLGTAGALGILVLGAGIRRLGLPNVLAVLAFCSLAGAAASLGWHGVRAGFRRHEEHLQATRRHRTPRSDVGESAAAVPEESREPDIDRAFAEFDARADAYLTPPPSQRWYGQSAVADHQDLYAHPGSSPR